MQCCTDRGGWIIYLIRGYQSGLQQQGNPTSTVLQSHDVASLTNSPCSYTILLNTNLPLHTGQENVNLCATFRHSLHGLLPFLKFQYTTNEAIMKLKPPQLSF